MHLSAWAARKGKNHRPAAALQTGHVKSSGIAPNICSQVAEYVAMISIGNRLFCHRLFKDELLFLHPNDQDLSSLRHDSFQSTNPTAVNCMESRIL
jgi:hypothetical protein